MRNTRGAAHPNGAVARQNIDLSWTPLVKTLKWANSTALGMVGLSDNPMVMSAQLGRGASPQVYNELDSEILAVPGTVLDAYAQSIYCMAVGIRRAMWDEKPRNDLEASIAEMSAELEAFKANLGFMCSWTGYFCPTGDPASVLDRTISTIERSSLSEDDKVRINSFLKANRTALWWKKVTPIIGVAVVSTAIVGVVWYRRSRAK